MPNSATLALAALALTAGLAHAQGCDPADIFGPPHETLVAGGLPLGIALGDANNDGILDLAVANSLSSTIRFYRGLGDGTFGFTITLAAAPHTANVIFGDITGDGIDDLVGVGDSDESLFIQDGVVHLYRSLGNGSFQASGTRETLNDAPSDIRLVDFNHDGALDIAAMQRANTIPDRVAILLGTGSGTFGGVNEVTTTNQSGFLAVGDLNDDGELDIVSGAFGFNTMGVNLGLGAAAFSELVNLGSRTSRGGIELADMNHDGILDIVSTGYSSVGVTLGNGDGTFASTQDFPVSPGADTGALAVGDLNGDGNIDVVTADSWYSRGLDSSFGTNTISVVFGNGDGTLTAPATYTTQGVPTSIKLGDLDNDGDLDVLYSHRGSNTVQIRLNQCITPPTIAQHPAALTAVNAGESVQLTVVRGDVGRPPFSYQWTRNGEPITDADGITGSDTDTLTIDSAVGADSDTYAVVISNGSGQVTSNLAAVVVRQPCTADLAEPFGTLDFSDVFAFLASFGAGCP